MHNMLTLSQVGCFTIMYMSGFKESKQCCAFHLHLQGLWHCALEVIPSLVVLPSSRKWTRQLACDFIAERQRTRTKPHWAGKGCENR